MLYDMTTDFGKRLKEARKHAGLTQQQLAKKVGIGQSTIAELERTGNGSSHVSTMAVTMRVSPLWLEKGVGNMLTGINKQPIDLDNNPDYPAIKRVKFKLSAGASGFGIEYQDEEGNPLVFRRDWYERNGYDPDNLLAVYVANGSMEPGLYDGDTVVVNTSQTEPKDGRVFAVNYEGEMVVKRMVRDEGRWWLSSDNPDQSRYPRKACHEGVHMIGEVVHKQSERI